MGKILYDYHLQKHYTADCQSLELMISKYFQDAQKAKQLLPHLKRGNRIEALVEFVASGSRLRVFIPKESCLVTFLLAGNKLI